MQGTSKARISLFLALFFSLFLPAAEPPFLRGMGWSPWHSVYGWGRPPEVVEADYRNLQKMHVNALRTWGGSKRENVETLLEKWGLYMVPQINGVKAPHMTFADGKRGHIAFAHPEAREAMKLRAQTLAKELVGARGLAAYNLGNEYSWVGPNKTREYQYQGFDEPTLRAFRAHLQQRFGTIAKWNEQTKRTDPSFAAILPPTGQGKSLLFWEWWSFQRQVFGEYLRAGYDACHAVDPETPVTYALLCGNRWDAATEDAALDFLDWQGDNLYYHWDKDWVKYSVRLARRIGPGRAALITESGINTKRFQNPEEADRLMRQMLWILFLHTEVKGVFPFVYCDEWWHGKDKKAQDTTEDYWGIMTADRKPKSTFNALQETYAEWERLGKLLDQRESTIELLVSDQAIDRWRGTDGPKVRDVARELYTHGVSLRLVSVLRPQDLQQTDCKRLLLLDNCLPDNPDGSFPMRDALRKFTAEGGKILYLGKKPLEDLYGTGGCENLPITRKPLQEKEKLWESIRNFVPERRIQVESESEVCFREFRSGEKEFLIVVATGSEIAENILIKTTRPLSLVSTDATSHTAGNGVWKLHKLRSYALFSLGKAQ